jgi:hypothetical protein
MKANLTNFSLQLGKIPFVFALFTIVGLIYPHVGFAAETNGQSALVFEVKTKDKTNESLKYSEIVENDPLIAKVRTYLESKKSPLAAYSEEIVKQPQWQRALAISFVESNFGKYCSDNNCSGIGVAPSHPNWRKYPTKLAWFKDMSQLLEKPIYKEKFVNCKAMKGVYVVPGSSNWVNGCNKVSEELLTLTKLAELEKSSLSVSNVQIAGITK